MRFRRNRFLITLVAAIFFANSVAVAAPAFITVMSGPHIVAVLAFAATGIEHFKPADNGQVLCLAHCAQSYRYHQQQLATNAAEPAFQPLSFVLYIPAKIKPDVVPVALAAQAAGPPLTILFHNLRN